MAERATYEAVRLSALTVDVPYMKAALGEWERARGNFLMPSEQSAEPLSIESALADTALIDVLRDPLDFKLRVLGSAMIAAQGVDYTGHLVSSLDLSGYAALARSAYVEVLTERAPAFHHVIFNDALGDRSYFRLLLPLAEDGREVTILWAVTHYYKGPWQPPKQ